MDQLENCTVLLQGAVFTLSWCRGYRSKHKKQNLPRVPLTIFVLIEEYFFFATSIKCFLFTGKKNLFPCFSDHSTNSPAHTASCSLHTLLLWSVSSFWSVLSRANTVPEQMFMKCPTQPAMSGTLQHRHNIYNWMDFLHEKQDKTAAWHFGFFPS